MKKKWKIICIVAGILATLLILGAGLLYLSFNGSIVRKVLITREVKAYVADRYPEEPYEVDLKERQEEESKAIARGEYEKKIE